MNVKIKNKEVPAILNALRELARLPVPVRTGLKIRRLVRLIEQQAADIEAERQRLLDLYAQRDEAGQRVIREDGNVVVDDRFYVTFGELVEVEFEAEPLTAEEIEAAGNVAPAMLIGLGGLLNE